MYIAADCCSQRDTVSVMFSVLPHSIFSVQNIVQTLLSTNDLYLQQLERSCFYMFNCTTAQQIYCSNIVQTVQTTIELYLL